MKGKKRFQQIVFTKTLRSSSYPQKIHIIPFGKKRPCDHVVAFDSRKMNTVIHLNWTTHKKAWLSERRLWE